MTAIFRRFQEEWPVPAFRGILKVFFLSNLEKILYETGARFPQIFQIQILQRVLFEQAVPQIAEPLDDKIIFDNFFFLKNSSLFSLTFDLNKNFQLLCNDGSENQLIELARKLDEKIAEIKTANPASSFELLLVMSALSLQDQTQNLNNKLDKINGSKNNDEDEKFAETLSTIALYLENLAQKIGK